MDGLSRAADTLGRRRNTGTSCRTAHLRHLNGIGQKRSQIPQGAELDGESEFVEIAAALGDQGEIGLVQEEVAGQLLRRGISSKPPVTGGLVIRD